MNGLVYKFDQNSGEYLGEYQSQESPLEPGKWLDDIPNTLKTAPPATGQNEAACAVNGAWVIKADYRETTWYKPDGSTVEITELGVLPEQGWSIEPPPETPEQVVARLESAIDRHLDAVANSYRYESIRTMVTYATSDHPTFGAEGRAAVKFRDACYAYGIQAISDVQDGKREIPTEVELIAELPTFESFLGT